MLVKDEFEKYMDEIDQEFIFGDLHIYQRPMQAFMRLVEKVDKTGRFRMRSIESVAKDDFSNDALCAQVHRWYEDRYGDRIKKHLGPGSYVILIRNEPWEVVLPLCFGRVSFTIDDNLKKQERKVRVESGEIIPEVNILWHFKSMPQGMASSLTYDERNSIFLDYIFGIDAVQSLKNNTATDFLKLASNDYDLAVYNIFQKQPDYNNSKWSSLQLVEKVMKSKLKQFGVPLKRTHDLKFLAKLLSDQGVTVSESLIERVHCMAGVRYGETKVTKHEAVDAVKCALVIYKQVYETMSFDFNY